MDQDGAAFYVTWGAGHVSSGDAAAAKFGRPLGRLSATDLQDVVAKGIIAYGRSATKAS